MSNENYLQICLQQIYEFHVCCHFFNTSLTSFFKDNKTSITVYNASKLLLIFFILPPAIPHPAELCGDSLFHGPSPHPIRQPRHITFEEQTVNCDIIYSILPVHAL